MRVKIHCKKFDTEFKMVLYAMTEFAMARLVESKRLRNNLSIDVHFRHHSAEGEPMIDHDTNPYPPRHFRVIIDHHRLEEDNYAVKEMSQSGTRSTQDSFHELVHVKQYVMGELSMRREGLCYRGVHYDVKTLTEYFELPYEIEAYGREKGLLIAFLAFWKGVCEEFDFSS